MKKIVKLLTMRLLVCVALLFVVSMAGVSIPASAHESCLNKACTLKVGPHSHDKREFPRKTRRETPPIGLVTSSPEARPAKTSISLAVMPTTLASLNNLAATATVALEMAIQVLVILATVVIRVGKAKEKAEEKAKVDLEVPNRTTAFFKDTNTEPGDCIAGLSYIFGINSMCSISCFSFSVSGRL